MIAPQASAQFVAAMEKVLDIYSRPYDVKHPVVCMDETPRQLIRETREPIPAAPGRQAPDQGHRAADQTGLGRVRAGHLCKLS